ncbi:MAG: hypothetical protein DHS20C14_15960 [Phycisphaeraceae bacterium]|nr:MAG: hypothetical protein DHS20C14_15960 [Phycisphaeraceae bacterium]
MGREQKHFELRTPEHFRAIASPVRRQIFFAAVNTGPSSVADLAEKTGRTVTSLYRHVKILHDAGLLVEAGSRGEGREREALYAARANRLTYAEGKLPKASRAAIARGIAGDLRRANKMVSAALESGRGVVAGPDRDAWGGSSVAWLTPAQLREVNEHLNAIYDLVEGTPERPGTRPLGLVHVLYPIDP